MPVKIRVPAPILVSAPFVAVLAADLLELMPRPVQPDPDPQDPNDPGVNNDLGYLYADQGKNLEKAEAMIRKAVQEEPDNPTPGRVALTRRGAARR